MEELGPGPQILTPCGSARRSIGVSNSPEFEFCNYIPPSPDLVCADDLFSGGLLLPFHRLRPSDEAPPPSTAPDPVPFWSDRGPPDPEIIHTPQLSSSSINNTISSSIRWRDIFRKNDKKSSQRRRSIDADAEKDIISTFIEMKKRERRNSTGGGGGVPAAELNINIWPFSRSRSTGNGAARAKSTAAARKVSSAPCSRSNSTGESKSKRWPGSPGRGGVQLGRTSPVVCQIRRGGGGGRRSNEAVVRKIPLPVSSGDGRSKAKVLSLNMPRCIGYGQHLSCKSEGSSTGGAAAPDGGGGSVSGEGVRGSSLFNIKSFFIKKVY